MRCLLLVSLCVLFIGPSACKSSSNSPAPANSSSGTSDNTATTSSSPQPGSSPAAPVATATKPRVDACALLSSKEIEATQGEAVKETKLSGQPGGGLDISQCFFTLPTFTNSISLLVANKGTGTGAKDPREFWRETFGKDSGEERERERDKKDKDKDNKGGRRGEEEEEESTPPLKVSGVGEDAFWIGSRVGGALYVLKGEAYIRISVGGSGDQTSKITKSKTLAQKAVARL